MVFDIATLIFYDVAIIILMEETRNEGYFGNF
jgi:hypothetical protein